MHVPDQQFVDGGFLAGLGQFDNGHGEEDLGEACREALV